MMKELHLEQQRGYVAGLVTAMADGGVSLPYVFLKYYHKLNLSEAEAMLIIQLIAYREKEEKSFPTIEEIQSRMSTDGDTVVRMLQRLIKQRIIEIVEEVDPSTGLQVERYSLSPLWMKLASVISKEDSLREYDGENGGQAVVSTVETGKHAAGSGIGETEESMAEFDGLNRGYGLIVGRQNEKTAEDNLFHIFEQEFGRPLTPMEVEMINNWLDHDRYSQALILAALKEAVFAGKVSFRYIDRILLDWHRNNIHTVEQAKEYTQKFRGLR